MKILGLTYNQVVECITKVDPNLKWNVMGDCAQTPGVVEGYMFYKASAITPYRAIVAGQIQHKPCGHACLKATQNMLDAGATTVWLEKLKFTKPVTQIHLSKLWAKLQEKQVTCNCVIGVIKEVKTTVTTGVLLPKPKPIQPVQDPLAMLHAPALSGDPVTGTATGIPQGRRPTQAVVTGLYILAELDQLVDDYVEHFSLARLRDTMVSYWCLNTEQRWDASRGLAGMMAPAYTLASEMVSGVEWVYRDKPVNLPAVEPTYDDMGRMIDPGRDAEKHGSVTHTYGRRETTPLDVKRALVLDSLREQDSGESRQAMYFLQEYWTFSRDYKATLARNLFDYLALACMGECRHSSDIQAWNPGEAKPSGRQASYAKAITMDPRQFLPIVKNVFTKLKWGSAYGGPKWGNIAQSTGLYFQFRTMPVVFADHVVDLSHNGGLAFNKGYIMDMPGSGYLPMLNYKRDHSLLRGMLALTLTPEVKSIMGAVLDFLRAPFRPSVVHVVPDATVPLVSWGTGKFEPMGKVTGVENVIVSEPDVKAYVPTHVKPKLIHVTETFPESRRQKKGGAK